MASFGAGALAGSLAWGAAAGPSRLWKRLQRGDYRLRRSRLFAIAPLLLGRLPTLALLFATGLCSALWTTTSQSILQLSAPDRLRGRVLSLYWFVFAGLTPFGCHLIGLLATVGGSELVFAVAGMVSPRDGLLRDLAHPRCGDHVALSTCSVSGLDAKSWSRRCRAAEC